MSSAYGVRGGQARGVNPRQVYAVWGAPHGLSHVGLSRVGLRNKRLGFVVRLSKVKVSAAGGIRSFAIKTRWRYDRRVIFFQIQEDIDGS